MNDISPSFPEEFSWITNQHVKETETTGGAAVTQAKCKWYPICPYVRFAQYDVILPSDIKAQRKFIPERIILDYEMMFVKSGSARIVIEGKEYLAKPNDLFIFKPNQRHSIELLGNETFIQPHIHFDLVAAKDSPQVFVSFKTYEEMNDYEKSLIREDITDRFISPFPNYLRPQNTYLIEQLIFEIIQKYESRSPYSQIALQGLFMRLWYSILLEIDGQSKKKLSSKELEVDEIKLYLEQTTDHAVTMDELASRFHLNKYYISRLFSKSYHTSPIQYHITQRVQQAMKLLFLTNMSVSEVAAAVGYSSVQSFSKVFKSVVGESPNSYRLSNNGEMPGGGFTHNNNY